jgi:hypothetical protein
VEDVLSPRKRRVLRWVALVSAVTLLVVSAVSVWLLRPARIKAQIERTMTERLGMDTAIEGVTLSLVPRPVLSGTGLTVRIPNRPDLAPFISIDHFSVDVGLMSGIRGHVDEVHLGGLKIVVPPGDDKAQIGAAAATAADNGGATPGSEPSKIVIDRLDAHDSQLTIMRRKPGHAPLVFAIHDLRVEDLGFDRAMPFSTTVTNPVPMGLVESSGTIGPWRKGDPTSLPIKGDYTFSNANLDTIHGIAGTLSSTGTYDGRLTEILVQGDTSTPDFNLDLGGKPVPLSATFRALVDATNGTTILQNVEARLFNTPLKVTGAITNLEGDAGRDVALEVEIVDGRIEDLLRLSIDSPKPLLTGDVQMRTTLSLPPGKTRVRNRLRLGGRFGLGSATFTDGQVQGKLEELSRRSQGKDKEDELGRVMTNLAGRFTLASGVLSLRDLSFHVPGAAVLLQGSYAIEGEALDFEGHLRMQATVSKAIGGIKSIFIKPFDVIFRKDGAGAVVPIAIKGTREQPKMSVKLFGGGKKK